MLTVYTLKDIYKFDLQNVIMDSSKEKLIDDIICETNEKLSAIAEEIRQIKFSNLDEKSKESKMNVLRIEFQKMLDEQQRRVLDITE